MTDNINMRYNVKTIYSYLKEQELGLGEIESIFLEAICGTESSKYTISFSLEDLLLSDYQCQATEELIKLNNRVAYLLFENNVIAIIGYIDKDR